MNAAALALRPAAPWPPLALHTSQLTHVLTGCFFPPLKLAGSHLATDFERWVEGEVAPLMRRAAAALGPAFLGTTPAMFSDALRVRARGRGRFWCALSRAAVLATARCVGGMAHAWHCTIDAYVQWWRKLPIGL